MWRLGRRDCQGTRLRGSHPRFFACFARPTKRVVDPVCVELWPAGPAPGSSHVCFTNMVLKIVGWLSLGSPRPSGAALGQAIACGLDLARLLFCWRGLPSMSIRLVQPVVYQLSLLVAGLQGPGLPARAVHAKLPAWFWARGTPFVFRIVYYITSFINWFHTFGRMASAALCLSVPRSLAFHAVC